MRGAVCSQQRLRAGNQAGLAGRKHFPLCRTALRCDPVLRRRVFGGQHYLAGLQHDAMTAFKALQDFFGFFTPTFDDFGELFEQGFGHEGVGGGVPPREPSAMPRSTDSSTKY